MHFYVITAFPVIFDGPLQETILKRAQEKELVKVDVINLRDFAEGRHKQLDDSPFGGGSGMVQMPEPIDKAFRSLPVKKGEKNTRFVYMSPMGKPLDQQKLEELKELENLIVLCGRYKGVDQRVIDSWVDEEISIGDYVLSGGEIPALVLIDGISRLVTGVLGNSLSPGTDSFSSGLLGYPSYTRPAEWQGKEVPEILLGGKHKEIAEWRLKKSEEKTESKRKDLFEKYLIEIEGKKDE
ncbi:MAG: tRNA (guanosine(37)-N1)-methyltransferase TrmD [bacterium]|nr:tRNA (guanosine(37)-N1)-methyltransferase TrmD [bacterium]